MIINSFSTIIYLCVKQISVRFATDLVYYSTTKKIQFSLLFKASQDVIMVL